MYWTFHLGLFRFLGSADMNEPNLPSGFWPYQLWCFRVWCKVRPNWFALVWTCTTTVCSWAWMLAPWRMSFCSTLVKWWHGASSAEGWSLPRSGVPASNADAALGVADQMPELVEQPRLAEPVRGQMCHWGHVGGIVLHGYDVNGTVKWWLLPKDAEADQQKTWRQGLNRGHRGQRRNVQRSLKGLQLPHGATM